jgi:hypothetical protein
MKKQVEDWILLADKDLYAAEILLNDRDFEPMEKYLGLNVYNT